MMKLGENNGRSICAPGILALGILFAVLMAATAGIGEASPNDNADRFETRMMLDTQWLLQRPLLKPQVDAADASYQKLLVLWSKFSGMPPTASTGAPL